MFEKAVKWQLIDENPCRRTEAPKAAEIEVEALQEEDVAKLLEALQDAPAQYSVITQLACSQVPAGARYAPCAGRTLTLTRV
mgnify:CR=1 FL=1